MSLKDPLQARSRQTMQRYVDAALRLVELERWEDVSVADLAAQANSSVGAFYARFGSKDALLSVLDDHYADALVSLMSAFADSEPGRFEAQVRVLLTRLVQFHAEHAGLARTLVLRARVGGGHTYTENSNRIHAEVPGVIAHLGRCDDVPEGCGRTELSMPGALVYSAMREQLLFPDAVPVPLQDADALVKVLTASFIGTAHALASR